MHVCFITSAKACRKHEGVAACQTADTMSSSTDMNIYTHIRPDADAFGTALAMAIIKGVKALFHVDDIENVPASIKAVIKKYPKVRSFMDSFGGYYDYDPKVDHESIVVDCGDKGRISAPDDQKAAGFALSYDHHCNEPVADAEMGRPDAPAAAAVVAQTCALPNDPVVATLLFAGLVGDTAGFSNSASTAEAFDAAALLVRKGADVQLVLDAIHQESASRARLKARAVSTLEQHEVVRKLDDPSMNVLVNLTVLAPEDFKAARAGKADYAGMPGEILAIDGALVAACLNLDNEAGMYRIAFRTSPSSPIRAKTLAMAFGGNGHPDAAGGSLVAASSADAVARVAEKIANMILGDE